MEEMTEKKFGVDWAVGASILFWIGVIALLITLISSGKTIIPQPVLEVIEASASTENIVIAHRNGDPVRFANTTCLWTPDISSPNITGEAGTLVLAGKENKQGIVSKLEPGEFAKLKNNINMKAGGVGRIFIVDRMSGQPIFSQTVKINQ